MKNVRRTFVAVIAVLAFAMPLAAQSSQDDEPADLAFQGRVGGMYTGGDPFENGAIFEVGGLYRVTGPIYLHVYGGLTNFDKTEGLVPLSDAFASAWDLFNETNTVSEINRLNYKMNFFGAGLAFVQDLGPLELQLNAGAGAYQVEFVVDFDYYPNDVPVELRSVFTQFLSLDDDDWLYGFTVGGGLYYDFNQIISFGGHVNYHAVDTDAIDDLISFTAGMHIKVP